MMKLTNHLIGYDKNDFVAKTEEDEEGVKREFYYFKPAFSDENVIVDSHVLDMYGIDLIILSEYSDNIFYCNKKAQKIYITQHNTCEVSGNINVSQYELEVLGGLFSTERYEVSIKYTDNHFYPAHLCVEYYE